MLKTKATRRPTNLKNNLLQGPGAFGGQFFSKNDPRFSSLKAMAETFAACGITSMELPLWCEGLIDFDKAVDSKIFCEELQGIATTAGCPIRRATNHLNWQNVAATAPMEPLFGGLCPKGMAGDCAAQRKWSANRVRGSIIIAEHFGFKGVGGFSGHHGATHLAYPWIPEPKGLFYAARADHAAQWEPLVKFGADHGQAIWWEWHPNQAIVSGDDALKYFEHLDADNLQMLMDLSHLILQGIPRRFLVAFVRYWGKLKKIGAVHIKEAIFDPTPNCGTLDYGPFAKKAARFRGLNDGDIGYVEVVEALDALNIVLDLMYEWEDCGNELGMTKGKEQALKEGAAYISALLNGQPLPERTEPIPHQDGGFEDFATVEPDEMIAQLARIMGLPISAIKLDPALVS